MCTYVCHGKIGSLCQLCSTCLDNEAPYLHVTNLLHSVLSAGASMAMPCIMSIIMHLKDPQLFLLRVGHCVMVAGFCLCTALAVPQHERVVM